MVLSQEQYFRNKFERKLAFHSIGKLFQYYSIKNPGIIQMVVSAEQKSCFLVYHYDYHHDQPESRGVRVFVCIFELAPASGSLNDPPPSLSSSRLRWKTHPDQLRCCCYRLFLSRIERSLTSHHMCLDQQEWEGVGAPTQLFNGPSYIHKP